MEIMELGDGVGVTEMPLGCMMEIMGSLAVGG